MDFAGSISRVGLSMMPSLAIFDREGRDLWSSWLVRLWLAAAALMAFLTLSANWPQMQTAPLVASLLFPFLVFPWFLMVIMLGITPVSGARLDALADGILSRPITRYEYLLACWLARVVVVLSIYLAVILPAAILLLFARRPAAEDSVTWYGLTVAICAGRLGPRLSSFAGLFRRNGTAATVAGRGRARFRLVSHQPRSAHLLAGRVLTDQPQPGPPHRAADGLAGDRRAAACQQARTCR